MQLLPEVSFDHLPPLSQSHILRLDAVLQRCTFPASCQIRDASIADAPALNDIFNDIVKSTMALSWTNSQPVEWRTHQIRDLQRLAYPCVVLLDNNKPVGYAYLGPYRECEQSAYRYSAELSVFLSEPYRNRGLLGFLWRAIVCHPLTVAREICTVTVWCSIIDVSGIRSLMKAFKHLGSAHSTYHRHGAWAGSSIWQASLRDRPILPRLSPTTSFPNISWDVPSMPDYAHMRSATRADAEWLRSLQIELRRSTISSLRNEDPKLSEIQDWIAAQESGYPLVVATNSKLQPLGYATLSSFLEPERKGCEYSAVLEVALFSSSRGHGIGTQLCQTLLDRAQHGRRRFYSILAFCSSDNADASSPAPDMFMLKNGFSRVYTTTGIAEKSGVWLDESMWQLFLGNAPSLENDDD